MIKLTKYIIFCSIFLLFSLPVFSTEIKGNQPDWKELEDNSFTLYYLKDDSNLYQEYLNTGIQTVQSFFSRQFIQKISVFIFPNRELLDVSWQSELKTPGFKSECWMVASGTANKLYILSPNAWKKDACEHNPDNKEEIQKIITHELLHAFHGQNNPNHDFDNMEEMDWFIEGLANYASGQLFEKSRISNIKKAFESYELPENFSELWKGKNKYGFSGFMSYLIDELYGREMLFDLLGCQNTSEVLHILKTDEEFLMEKWKMFVKEKLDEMD
jgi:hypothetical protein